MSTNTISIEQALKDANSSVNQDIKGVFVVREVFCNVGSLVEYCLKHGFEDSDSPVNMDELENYYSYPEYYGSYASFEGGTEAQRDEEIERLEDVFGEFEEQGNTEAAEAVRAEIDALNDLESEPQEVYEWWAVSSYLFDKLREMGYVVIDTGSCYVWGRTTSGQAILLDHVISKICADMEILDGQANSWARK